MNDLFQQFVNWLPQFSNTPSGLRIVINASHIWALVYPAIGVLSLLTVKRYVSKFFAWRQSKQERKIQEQEREIQEQERKIQEQRKLKDEEDRQAKVALPGPWHSLYKRLLTIASRSAARLLVESFIEQHSSLPTITPEGYRFLLRSTKFTKSDKKDVKFLLGAVGKYVRYQTGTEPVMIHGFPDKKPNLRGPDEKFPGIWHVLRNNLAEVEHLAVPDKEKDTHRENIISQFINQNRAEIEACPLPYSTYVLLYETFNSISLRATLSAYISPKTCVTASLDPAQINKALEAVDRYPFKLL